MSVKLLIVEDLNIKKSLIDTAIDGLGISSVSFTSINDAFEHIEHDQSPFILISEIISASEAIRKKMQQALSLAHFKCIVFLSQYSDDILDVIKKISKEMGVDNIHGIGFSDASEKIKNKIIQAVNFKKSQRLKSLSYFHLDIDEIEMALINDLFQPYFQAQVCAQSEKIIGFEILSRLCVDDDVYTPDSFIETLINCNRITDFTFIILRKAVFLLKKYKEFSGTLSLNVDYQSLGYENFARDIIEILKLADFSTSRFTVEITENRPTINITVMRNLMLFRMAECQLSIDDFGTKKSGFTELLKFPFSELKIDKSFVTEMMESPRGYKVVKALCAVADSLDCSVVAEGVETEEQRNLLRGLNVCHLQGYLYSKPKPIGEAMKLLTDYVDLANC